MSYEMIGGEVEIDAFQEGSSNVYVTHGDISVLLKVPSELNGASCAEQAASSEYTATVVCRLVQKALTAWINKTLPRLDS